MQLKTRSRNHIFPKRVALVTDSFRIGGGLEHLVQIAKGIPDTTFGVFGSEGEGANNFKNLQNVLVFQGRFSLKKILDFSPDIIHFHHLKPLLQYYVIPSFLKRDVRLFLTLHGLHIHKYQFMSGLKARTKEFVRYWLEKLLFRKVDKIITVSKGDKEVVQKKFLVPDPLYIPNGIDPRPFRINPVSKDSLKRDLGLSGSPFVFFTPARFELEKGHDVLLHAISLVKDLLNRSNVKFILAGDGKYFLPMQKLARNLGISDYILFLGSRRDIYQLMKASDVLILPSRYEGLPIALLEASFAELPMIASNACGIKEVISHGDTGLLFKNESSEGLASLISQVLNKELSMEQFARNAFVKASEDFHVNKMTSQLLEAYQLA